MDEETIEGMRYPFPAYSALYHTVKGLIFMRGSFANKVISLLPDENDRNLKIRNEKRLKEKLFNNIMRSYNDRIDDHNLLLQKLVNSRKDDVEIIKFKLIGSMEDDELDYSGRYMVFPRTFVCSKCGNFRIVHKDEWNIFNPNKCMNSWCDGKYEQVSIVMFCEQCGKIVPLYYPCKKHGNKHLRLIRKEKDSLLTWRVVCQKCQEEGNLQPIDIFRFNCGHFENYEKICNEKETKFKPLTIKEGGVYTPVVITSVDIPPTESIHLEDLEYVLLGLHIGKFDKISERVGSVDLEKIESYYRAYNDENIRQFISSDIKDFINIIESTITELKIKYEGVDLENFNDFFAIKNKGTKSYDEYIKYIADEARREILDQNYKKLKAKHGIENISYISEINLLSSCIGIINGINKFYEPSFVPHFNPIWKNARKKDKIVVYTYPFETEGVLLEMDKIKTCNWLISNGLIADKKPDSISQASQILFTIKNDTEAYKALKTLLHTLSHVLIWRSSLYTGLDSDSCSELIFVNPAAIMIYSTSNINIGGFQFVFEHSLEDWFREVEFDIEACTFDPACITERGACFSCLYLPEYVCTEFNQFLDRDVFMGRRRYSVGYWQERGG
jgi:hypothetical protein